MLGVLFWIWAVYEAFVAWLGLWGKYEDFGGKTDMWSCPRRVRFSDSGTVIRENHNFGWPWPEMLA